MKPFPFPEFPISRHSPSPGCKHASIDDIFLAIGEEWTRSILDMLKIAEFSELCAVTPLSEALLRRLFGTSKPSRAKVEKNMDFVLDVERGHGVCVIVYDGNQPERILFAGMSFD